MGRKSTNIERMIRAMALTLTLVVAEAALACSCITIDAPPTRGELTMPRLRVLRATVVKVEAIDPTGDPAVDAWFVNGSRTTFRVTRSWNGPVRREVIVESGFAGGGCGYQFKPNVEYLVFAEKNKDGALVTSICSRTTPLKNAPELLRAIEKAVGRGRKPRN